MDSVAEILLLTLEIVLRLALLLETFDSELKRLVFCLHTALDCEHVEELNAV